MQLGSYKLASACLLPGLWLALSLAGPAAAQGTGLRDALSGSRFMGGRSAVTPPVARYMAGDQRAFVLDRSGQAPLLKFEDSAEIWVLRPSPGPRGDVIYKDELGRQMLRASRLGGVTVFTADKPGGLPAALTGRGAAIRLRVVDPQELYEHFRAQSRRVSRLIRKRVGFETGADATAATAILFADAATIAAEAVDRFAGRSGARSVLGRLDTVRITLGRRPNAAVVGGDTLEITLAPHMGVAGRPSSERIVRALDAAG